MQSLLLQGYVSRRKDYKIGHHECLLLFLMVRTINYGMREYKLTWRILIFGAMEEDYEIYSLQKKSHHAPNQKSQGKTIKSKAKEPLFHENHDSHITKDIQNFLKKEYARNERIRGMKVLNLMREFELKKMKGKMKE